MFSFASKMLNSLIGEGEQPPRPQGPRPPLQPGPGMQPPYARPTRPQAPMYRAPGQDMGRPRLAVLGRNPSSQIQQPPLPRKEGAEEPNLDLSHLSAEERAMIQNVMKKAKTLEDNPKVDSGLSLSMRNQQEGIRLAHAQSLGQGMGPRPGMYNPYPNQQENLHIQQQSMHPTASIQAHGTMQHNSNSNQLQNIQQHNTTQLHSSVQQHSTTLQNQTRQDAYNQGLRTDPYKRQDNYQESSQRQDNYHQQNGFQQQNDYTAPGYSQQRNEYRPDSFSNGYSTRTEPSTETDVQERPSTDYRQNQEQSRQEAQARQDQYRTNVLQDHHTMHRSEPFRQDGIQDQLSRQDLQSNQFRQETTTSQDQARQEQINRIQQQEIQQARNQQQQYMQEEFGITQRQQDQYSTNPNKEFQLNRQDSFKQNNSFINSACWERSEKLETKDEEPKEQSPVVVVAEQEPSSSTTATQQPVAKDEIKPPSLIESFYDHSPGEVYTIPEEEDEVSSPTGGDGVTSLRKQRLAAGAPPTIKSTLEENGPTASTSGSDMKTKNLCIQSSSKTFADSTMIGQSTSLQDRELDNLNGYGINSIENYNRTSSRRLETAPTELTTRLSELGINDNQKDLSMKTELEGPNAKSPLTTHKWATSDDYYDRPLETDDNLTHPYKQYFQNDKLNNPQLNQSHENHHLTAIERHPESLHNNRPSTSNENVTSNYSPKSQSPILKTPQTFHIRPKTPFAIKPNQMDTDSMTKEESWKSPMAMQDEMHYQHPMLHEEYPMDSLIFNEHREKPRLLQLQGDLQDEMKQKQGNPSQQAGQSGKAGAGTISGMLADFSRALGLSASTTSPSRPSPTDELTNDNQLSYQESHSQDHNQSYQRPLSQQQIQATIKANEKFMHGSQGQVDKSSVQQYPQSQYAYDNKGMIAGDMKVNDPYGVQKSYGMQQPMQSTQQILAQQQGQMMGQNFSYGQDQMNRMAQMQPGTLQQQNMYQQQLLQQQIQQQQLQQQKQAQIQQSLQNQMQRSNDYAQLVHMGETEQHQLFQQQQQLFQKLGDYQPVYAQNLTPQQQQMYQQHMQLQHHAQHLKKIRRSNLDSRGQGQFQKKENILNLIGQSTAVGSGVTLQQLGAAQLVNQQTGSVQQILNSQHLSNYISADKLNALSRPTAVSSQPVIVTSSYGNQQVNSVTPLGTPQSTPVGTPRGPRDGGDSSDTMSETDSQKSLRTRRKLPSIPTDQEAVTLPSAKKRDRGKIKSSHERFSPSCSPLRQYGDGGYRIASNLMLQRPSASETNLRKVSHGPEQIPRPGSALGLLQGSSVVSSGLRSDYSKEAEIASCLPPDLRHLVSSYKGDTSAYSPNKSLILQTYKDSLSNEMKISAADRRALGRLSDWDSERLLERNKEILRSPKSRLDIQRKIAFSGLGRQRKLRAHRRQLSDPKLHLDVHPMKDTGESSYSRGYLGIGPSNLRPPYKSYEYESIDDGKSLDWDHSQPYLSSYAMAGGALRETAINSVLDSEHYSNDPSRYEMRRYSDNFEWRRREVGSATKGRKPRSWQPSPFASDEEEDSLSREEKKAKIKLEIARRRQQIEENARLHEELLTLARLRESAELGYSPVGGTIAYSGGYARSSVLKSIDDLLVSRDSQPANSHRTPEDRSMDRIASTFRTEDYTSGVYERLSDFSPVTDYSTPHAMPLLPDMPTRSRKLLQDLGSSPITAPVLDAQHKEEGSESLLDLGRGSGNMTENWDLVEQLAYETSSTSPISSEILEQLLFKQIYEKFLIEKDGSVLRCVITLA